MIGCRGGDYQQCKVYYNSRELLKHTSVWALREEPCQPVEIQEGEVNDQTEKSSTDHCVARSRPRSVGHYSSVSSLNFNQERYEGVKMLNLLYASS